jgi:hypothetical protein
VLFGGSPDSHEAYDPERRRVDQLLKMNPKTCPSLLPEFSGGLVAGLTTTALLLVAWWLCPAAWLELVPGAPNNDNDDDDDGGSGGGGIEDYRREVLAYASIPLVSCVFTYFHIWLALWMMFYPIGFLGCWCAILGCSIIDLIVLGLDLNFMCEWYTNDMYALTTTTGTPLAIPHHHHSLITLIHHDHPPTMPRHPDPQP